MNSTIKGPTWSKSHLANTLKAVAEKFLELTLQKVAYRMATMEGGCNEVAAGKAVHYTSEKVAWR